MTKYIGKFLSLVLVVTLVSACQQPPIGKREDGNLKKADIGTWAGAVGGAVLGAQVGKGNGKLVGVAVGTLLGAAIGNSIGESLDKADLAYYNQTSQGALEDNRVGETSTWRNPDSGNYGTVTPTRTFETAEDQPCREYSQTITIDGRTEKGYGTACRDVDGTWRIYN